MNTQFNDIHKCGIASLAITSDYYTLQPKQSLRLIAELFGRKLIYRVEWHKRTTLM